MSALETTHVELDHRTWLTQRWALVDPVALEPALWNDLPNTVLRPARLALEESTLPRLVHLHRLEPDVRIGVMERSHAWLRDSGKPLFGALLDVAADDGAPAAHLAGCMSVPRASRGRFWLRFHDHRVFGHLLRIFTPAQLARLFGPVRTWTWFDPNQDAWLQLEKPDAPSASLRSLDAAQWEKLQRVELLNAVASSLRRKPETPDLDVESMARLDGVLADILGSSGRASRRDICRRAEQRFLQRPLAQPTARTATV